MDFSTSPEIRSRIFRYLSSADLQQAALVCKCWTDGALDTRFRMHPVTLEDLLRPLDDLFGSARISTDALASPAVKPVWDTFQTKWGTRIYQVDFNSFDIPEMVSHLVRAGLQPLCPNLSLLSITLEPESGSDDDEEGAGTGHLSKLKHVLLLLSNPSLRSVEIGQTEPEAGEKTLEVCLETLRRTSLQLEDLTLCTLKTSYPYGAAFPHLKSLCIRGFIDSDAWISLANSPELESVVFRGMPTDDVPDDRLDREVTMEALKRLSILDSFGCHQIAFITSLFQQTRMPALATLHVQHEDLSLAAVQIQESLVIGSPSLENVRSPSKMTLVGGDVSKMDEPDF